MNNIQLLQNSPATMSSREIAELTGKEHRNVMRDCEVLNENYEKLGMLKIEHTPYTNPQNGQTYREYILTKMQCFDLLTGYRTDLRIKVNRRWEELETEKANGGFKIPSTLSEALRLAAEQTEQIEAQQKQIEAMRPKELFADAVATSDKTVLIAELAKILRQNGIDMGQNRLFEWLRQCGYLCTKGEYYNQPTQRAMEMGLFEVKKTSITKPDGVVLVTCTTKVTGKGQIYFVNKFLSQKVA
jgi:anti-repressor protein